MLFWHNTDMTRTQKPFSASSLSLSRARFAVSAAALALPFTMAPAALAAGTPAGTDIENVASASYETPAGTTINVDSNAVIITVDELLDVVVVSSDAGDIPTQPGATEEVLTFQVTNSGNGNEAFTLTPDVAVAGDDFDPTLNQVVLDTNGNGVYDAGVDEVYVPGTNDPALDPDESITVFVLTDIPNTPEDGDRAEVSLNAVANTGSGTPGTSFDGQGEGGGDAVVGSTGADDEDSSFLAIQAAILELIKSATVVDPFGGDQAVPGSVITYQIVATVSGSGSLSNLIVSDPIPANTSYVPGSIVYELSSQTDADDTDEGSFDGSQITAEIGSVPSGNTRTVTFQVTIQ